VSQSEAEETENIAVKVLSYCFSLHLAGK